jgi:hypothetical protein
MEIPGEGGTNMPTTYRLYVVHPGIGIARLGSIAAPPPDPCLPIENVIESLEEEIDAIQSVLDGEGPHLTAKQRENLQKDLAKKKAQLQKLVVALKKCEEDNKPKQKPKPEYFIGPEVPDEGFVPPGGNYRDASKNIKRQATRFRIYEYTLTYTTFSQLQQAIDAVFTGKLKPGTLVKEITSADADIEWHVHLVNAKSMDAMGASVVNDPGERNIGGVNQWLDVSGSIFGDEVQLGSLATDSKGRLLVLGGFGKSASPAGAPLVSLRNPQWYDDVSDGPVRVTITLKGSGEQPPVEPAWAIVGVPGFAHPIPSIVTLWDLAYDVATQLPAPHTLTPPSPVSFTRDVYTLLRRPVLMQWVSALARSGHSGAFAGNFLDPATFAVLQDNNANPMSAAYKLRQHVFEQLKNPSGGGGDMPQLYGLAVTKTQYAMMKQWADGNFSSDWAGPLAVVPFDMLAPADQPGALDRAGLITTVGGAFYPGIEACSVAAQTTSYDHPMRIREDLAPGSLTSILSVPWQSDYTACGSGWWPAGRPNEVTQDGSAFYTWKPASWVYKDMVQNWWQLGFIAKKTIMGKDAFVETERIAPTV